MAAIEKQMIGDKLVMPFTIPSGIVTTEPSCLESIAWEVPEIGILTTKSIGPEPRAGNREPIFAQYAPHCFINAVGLTNPGAEEFARKLSGISLPSDKFLLISIFGKNAEEFVYVARTLGEFADGFELNLSCPHAKGYGMQLGQDPAIVAEIVGAVKNVTQKPIFAKLTPNAASIGDIAKAAMDTGAYGLTAINTVGPGAYMFDDHYVLTNKVGGLSGRGITPIGIKAVKDITEKLGNVPIIGMGGISTADDVRAYARAGATYFGIGSALAGMTEEDIQGYFPSLIHDLRQGTNIAAGLIHYVDMTPRPFKVANRIDLAPDFHVLEMSSGLKALPGQFVFAYIPDKGEKPFSVMDTEPLTIGFLGRGCFTKELSQLKAGDTLYFRGPHGSELDVPPDEKVVLVGGGSGICGIYQFAKEHPGAQIFVGAKDKDHIPFLDRLNQYGKVHIATEDGSLGYHGMITGLLEKELGEGTFIINCGPAPMVGAVLPIEQRFAERAKIFSSIEYMTRCGVGICGSCADNNGKRTCVEGPFS